MSIVTWIENGKKQYAIFESKYFDSVESNFPVFESHRQTLNDIVAFSEDEVVLVSGDRKRYRLLQPISSQTKLPASKPRRPVPKKKIA